MEKRFDNVIEVNVNDKLYNVDIEGIIRKYGLIPEKTFVILRFTDGVELSMGYMCFNKATEGNLTCRYYIEKLEKVYLLEIK